MAWRYVLEGTGENVAIRRYKGYVSTGVPTMLYPEFYQVLQKISYNELVILHYLIEHMNISNEINIDNTVYRDLQLIMGYFEGEEKPPEYRYPEENVSLYMSKLKARGNIIVKHSGKTWFVNPKIAFKGSKNSRKYFMALYSTFIDMRLHSPNITFNSSAMQVYVRELADILNQNGVDNNSPNMIKRLNKANKEYKEKSNIKKILVPHYERTRTQKVKK